MGEKFNKTLWHEYIMERQKKCTLMLNANYINFIVPSAHIKTDLTVIRTQIME